MAVGCRQGAKTGPGKEAEIGHPLTPSLGLTMIPDRPQHHPQVHKLILSTDPLHKPTWQQPHMHLATD